MLVINARQQVVAPFVQTDLASDAATLLYECVFTTQDGALATVAIFYYVL